MGHGGVSELLCDVGVSEESGEDEVGQADRVRVRLDRQHLSVHRLHRGATPRAQAGLSSLDNNCNAIMVCFYYCFN